MKVKSFRSEQYSSRNCKFTDLSNSITRSDPLPNPLGALGITIKLIQNSLINTCLRFLYYTPTLKAISVSCKLILMNLGLFWSSQYSASGYYSLKFLQSLYNFSSLFKGSIIWKIDFKAFEEKRWFATHLFFHRNGNSIIFFWPIRSFINLSI